MWPAAMIVAIIATGLAVWGIARFIRENTETKVEADTLRERMRKEDERAEKRLEAVRRLKRLKQKIPNDWKKVEELRKNGPINLDKV